MKPCNMQYALLVCALLLGASPSHAQQFDEEGALLDGYSSVPIVGQVISAVQDAIDELIAEALDRFDASLLLAAMEARATVNQVATQFDDVLERTVEELDGQQRRSISDITSLATRLTNTASSDVSSLVNSIRQDVRLLVSRNPGFVHVIPGYAVENEDYIEFALEGTALSRARLSDFRVGPTPTEPPIATMDDTRVAIRVSLDTGPVADLLKTSTGDDYPLEVPISFILEECRFFGLWCSEGRRFRILGYVLPDNVGTVRAVFVGDVRTEQRREVTRGPFESPRVKSNWRGKSGKRTDVWAARPDDGWKIDVDSARFNFTLVFGGCSGRRCAASWMQQDEQLLRVWTQTETDRTPYVTCKTATTITFTQWMSRTERQTSKTDVVNIELGARAVLPLDSESGLVNARLAHLEIESDLVRGGTKILRNGESTGGLTVDYDPATQIAYLQVAYGN